MRLNTQRPFQRSRRSSHLFASQFCKVVFVVSLKGLGVFQPQTQTDLLTEYKPMLNLTPELGETILAVALPVGFPIVQTKGQRHFFEVRGRRYELRLYPLLTF